MSELAQRTLAAVYQHRLITTDQLQRLLSPHALSSRSQRRVLGRLRGEGLLDSVPLRAIAPSRARVWWCTSAGAGSAEASRLVIARPYRMSAARAGAAHQAHALAVTECAIAFAAHARRLGDDCGPFDTTPEIAHSLTTNEQRADLVSDALVSYVVCRDRDRVPVQFAIELDRATMNVDRLVSKVLAYTRYYSWTPAGASYPAWRRRYAHFPRLLVVLTGRGEAALEARMGELQRRLEQYPQVLTVRGSMHAYVCTLADLRTHGPAAAITRPLFYPGAEATALFPAPSTQRAAESVVVA